MTGSKGDGVKPAEWTGPGDWWADLLIADEEPDRNSIDQGIYSSASTYFVRGTDCLTTDALFQEWARQLSFPAYFGGNWDAFEECLVDFAEGCSATRCLVFVTRAEYILRDEAQDIPTFLQTLTTCAESIPELGMFRVIFHAEPSADAEAFAEAARSIPIRWRSSDEISRFRTH